MLLDELLVMTHSGVHCSLKCKRNHLTVLSLMKHKKCFHKCLFVCSSTRKWTVEISCNLDNLNRRLKNCYFSIWSLSFQRVFDLKNPKLLQKPSKQTHQKNPQQTHNENKQEKPTNKQKTQKQKHEEKERKYTHILLDRQGPEHFPHTEYKPQCLI